MRKTFISIVVGLITLAPTSSHASPYYTEPVYSSEYNAQQYSWASWIFDWTWFDNWLNNYSYEETSVDQAQPFFYPKAQVTDVSFGFAPRSEPIVPTNAVVPSPEYRCSLACPGTTGSVGYSPGEVGYNDGIHFIAHDPSNGRIYQALNFDYVSSNWVAMGCESNATSACFIK